MEENANTEDAAPVKHHIMIIDDDVIALRIFNNVFADDYRVTVAKSGVQALSYLGKEKPDLILLDYEMPVMNGPQTLEAIRSEREYKNIPVFFLTSVKDAEAVKKAVMLKPEGYILKTVTPNELKNRISDYFEQHY